MVRARILGELQHRRSASLGCKSRGYSSGADLAKRNLAAAHYYAGDLGIVDLGVGTKIATDHGGVQYLVDRSVVYCGGEKRPINRL